MPGWWRPEEHFIIGSKKGDMDCQVNAYALMIRWTTG